MSDQKLIFIKPSNLDIKQVLIDRRTIILRARTIRSGRKVTALKEFKSQNLFKHLKYCYYFIDLLYKRRRYNPDEYGINSFIHVHQETLTKVIPKDTSTLVLNLLNELEIIESNDSYWNRENPFSKSYRLSEKYRNAVYTTIEINDQKFLNKIQVNKKKISLNKTVTIFEYNLQHRQISSISFDAESAKEELLYARNNFELGDEEYGKVLASIVELESGDFHFTISGKVNRVFTTVSQANKLIRKHIKDNDGRSLVYIDITSSVVYMLYLFLKNYTCKKDGTLRILSSLDTNKKDTTLRVTNSNNHVTNLDRELSLNVSSFSLDSELRIFKDWLDGGDFYERLQDKLNRNGSYYSREDVKKLLMKEWLNNKKGRLTLGYKAIRNVFPSISSFLLIYFKSIEGTDKKILANRLMRLEAELINNRIVKRIYEECQFPRPVLYTIFDGIMIDAASFDEAYNIFLEEMETFTGLEPRVDVVDLEDSVQKVKLPDGQEVYLNTDYLDKLMKVDRKGTSVESFNRYMRTFNRKKEFEKVMSN